MPYIARYRYPVPSYLCDTSKRLKPHAILHFFEDAAWRNAEDLGFGHTQFYAMGRMWVLSRVRIEIDRYPRWQEEIRLDTWPAGVEKLFALRHFEIRTDSGAPCVRAATQWLLLDSEGGRPIPPLRVFDERFLAEIPKQRACERAPVRLPPPAPGMDAGTVAAGYSSIDVNDHVNNAEFVRWGFDAVCEEFDELPTLIEIDFKSAVMRGQSLLLRRDGESRHGAQEATVYSVAATSIEGDAVSVARFSV